MDIDIVIPWVDGSDPRWQDSYQKYVHLSNNRDCNTISRFRDWDNLQYLFRGIEKYMPWVRKIHFVTCGQKPKWLNMNASKLNFVTHESFISNEYLPTFSVRPIELNLHRIPDLAERFIYFNDDFFLLKPLSEEAFFKKGLPVDIAALNVLLSYSPRCLVMANNTVIINSFFNIKDVISNNKKIWFKLSYRQKLFQTLRLMRYNFFPGFQDTHLPQPYLKSTYQDVWNHCEDRLVNTCSHKFRDISDVNQSLMRYWQIVSGNIFPQNVFKNRKYFLISDNNIDNICDAIINHKRAILILNDSDNIEKFDEAKKRIKAAFDEVLPNKSSFEL